MSVITYAAKRKIEKTAYLKTGTDISAAAADDSFNSISTNLSGLLDNEWANVSGFANAANNGWFQANGNSAANKITQDTTTSLVTESAGPSIVVQGYKRGYGQAYQIEFTPRRLQASGKRIKKQSRAIGGAEETLLHRLEDFWDVGTGRLIEAAMPQWREFLASVASGETFTFDPYGTIAAPNAPVSCELDSDDYAESRLGATQRYTVAFRIRLL